MYETETEVMKTRVHDYRAKYFYGKTISSFFQVTGVLDNN